MHTARLNRRAFLCYNLLGVVVALTARILLADNDAVFMKWLQVWLQQEGYHIDLAFDGKTAQEKFAGNGYDLVVLEVTLKEPSGFEVCHYIREASDVPIMMFSAQGEEMDRILPFDYGADDYMTKPFNMLEFRARIKVLIRRYRLTTFQSARLRYEAAGILLDIANHTVLVDGSPINCTLTDFGILKRLLSRPGDVVSREELCNAVHLAPTDFLTLDQYIHRLRKKIDKNPANSRILAKWGLGYHLRVD